MPKPIGSKIGSIRNGTPCGKKVDRVVEAGQRGWIVGYGHDLAAPIGGRVPILAVD